MRKLPALSSNRLAAHRPLSIGGELVVSPFLGSKRRPMKYWTESETTPEEQITRINSALDSLLEMKIFPPNTLFLDNPTQNCLYILHDTLRVNRVCEMDSREIKDNGQLRELVDQSEAVSGSA